MYFRKGEGEKKRTNIYKTKEKNKPSSRSKNFSFCSVKKTEIEGKTEAARQPSGKKRHGEYAFPRI